MKIRQGAGQFPVHLFRIGRKLVAGTQACFHMPQLDLGIIGRQGSRKGRSGIAVDQDQVRLRFGNHVFQPQQRFYRDIVQGLPAGHDIQVIVRFDGKQFQHLVQHFPMLGRYRHNRLDEVRIFPHFHHQRTHFDSFRPGTEYCHDSQFFQAVFPPPRFVSQVLPASGSQ